MVHRFYTKYLTKVKLVTCFALGFYCGVYVNVSLTVEKSLMTTVTSHAPRRFRSDAPIPKYNVRRIARNNAFQGSGNKLNFTLPCLELNHRANKILPVPPASQGHFEVTSVVLGTSLSSLAERRRIELNVVENWPKLSRVIQPVLFNTSTDDVLLRHATSRGWNVITMATSNRTERRLPKIKAMFAEMMRQYPEADFYGYANGDILFDNGLITTLNKLLTHQGSLGSILLTGGRFNYKQIRNTTINDPAYVRSLVINNSTIIGVQHLFAEDYFFIYRDAFPWELVPDDLVIGTPGYDNLLVSLAGYRNVSVVDGSCTVGALHQTGVPTTWSESRDKHVNRDVIMAAGVYRKLQQGSLDKTQYFSAYSKQGAFVLCRRYVFIKYVPSAFMNMFKTKKSYKSRTNINTKNLLVGKV